MNTLEGHVDQAMKPRLRFVGVYRYALPTPLGILARCEYRWVDQYDQVWGYERDHWRILVLLGRH